MYFHTSFNILEISVRKPQTESQVGQTILEQIVNELNKHYTISVLVNWLFKVEFFDSCCHCILFQSVHCTLPFTRTELFKHWSILIYWYLEAIKLIVMIFSYDIPIWINPNASRQLGAQESLLFWSNGYFRELLRSAAEFCSTVCFFM